MSSTRHVSALVLAALCGCDGRLILDHDGDTLPATHDSDVAPTDTDTDTDGDDAPTGPDLTGCADFDDDGVCDDVDACYGPGVVADADGDRVCEDVDVCRGDDASGDGDGDGVCDDLDDCAGPGIVADADGDGSCQDLDPCLGTDVTGNDDHDAWCDDVDPCDDRVVAPGTLCTPPSPIPSNPCGGEPRLLDGRHTGFVTCPSGAVDRLFATTGWLAPETDVVDTRPNLYGGQDLCTDDAECTDGLHGACVPTSNGYDSPNACVYGCDADVDCGPGHACLPPTAGQSYDEQRLAFAVGSATHGRGVCIVADCLTGADCASGRCGYRWNYNYCYTGGSSLGCRTPGVDDCETNQPCAPLNDGWSVGVCNYVDQSYQCMARNAVCGRPLLDEDGVAVLAPLRRGASDWRGAVVIGLPTGRKARRALARHWARIGAMEHASVASFARHALQLLALGAPAELLADVSAAMADEVRHAQAAFGVAAALGLDVGPGAMPVGEVTLATDVDAVIAALVREGCVGETIAAAEARWLADRAVDAGLRGVLERIADDEARHAALAWRTVAWLVGHAPDRLARAEAIVDEVLACGAGDGDGEGLAGWGVIDRAGRAAVRADVVSAVIGPAVAALAGRAA